MGSGPTGARRAGEGGVRGLGKRAEREGGVILKTLFKMKKIAIVFLPFSFWPAGPVLPTIATSDPAGGDVLSSGWNVDRQGARKARGCRGLCKRAAGEG